MTAAAATPLAGRRLQKQLVEARRIADQLVNAVADVQRVAVATHADGAVTISLRVATSTSARPGGRAKP